MAADGGIFRLEGPAEGKSLLFPLQPQPGETLHGFILRSAAANGFLNARPIRLMAGLGPVEVSSAWTYGVPDLQRVADALGIPPEEAAGLWGASPLVGGRRRLGGVWLRPKSIYTSSRRMPTSVSEDSADQGFWMVSDLGFCSKTWELLVTKCPVCRCRPLWLSASAPHLCQCGGDISKAKKRLVPKVDRPVLGWLASLFSDDDQIVEHALRQLPSDSLVVSATDAFEVVMALARPMAALRGADRSFTRPILADVAHATRFLLEFPRSYWDVRQQHEDVRVELMKRIEGVMRHTSQIVVQRELYRMLHYWRRNWRPEAGFPPKEPLVNLAATARYLCVQRGDVRRLVAAGLLQDVDPRGGRERVHSVFRRHEVERIKKDTRARVSWRAFRSSHSLPTEALDQLLGLRVLTESQNATVQLLFGDRQLDRETASVFAKRLLDQAPIDFDGAYVALGGVMTGVGGRPKSWGRVLLAGLDGNLPGGFRRSEGCSDLGRLRVHPLTARGLIMGGSRYVGPFQCLPGDLAGWRTEEIDPGEACRFLNCAPDDLRWLKAKQLIKPINPKGTATKFDRSEVEALGLALITTREISARRGISAKAMRELLEPFRQTNGLGQGFYRREPMENWLASLPIEPL